MAAAQQEWANRSVERAWDDYTRALEELAGTGAVDVLAHPDVVKVTGRRPAAPAEFYDRIAEAARSCGLAAELNSSGWRKPCAEAYPAPALLDRFRKLGVPITTASDGHQLDLVSWRIGDLTAMARAAGYDEVTTFRARRPQSRPL
jgi:histidinol-phosphatase (PHP family)